MIHEFIQLVRSHSPGTAPPLILSRNLNPAPIQPLLPTTILLSPNIPFKRMPLTSTPYTSSQSVTGVIILYYCLDPVFPGLDDLTSFDVDGYLTNSEVGSTRLKTIHRSSTHIICIITQLKSHHLSLH